MINSLVDQLMRDEGEIFHMYVDSEGNRTIGVGHNLDTTPISPAASAQILEDDIQGCIRVLETWPVWKMLDPVRREVLVNIAFWAGVGGLGGFHHMLSYAAKGDYLSAAWEIEQSDLARVDRSRALRLGEQMRTGVRQ